MVIVRLSLTTKLERMPTQPTKVLHVELHGPKQERMLLLESYPAVTQQKRLEARTKSYIQLKLGSPRVVIPLPRVQSPEKVLPRNLPLSYVAMLCLLLVYDTMRG